MREIPESVLRQFAIDCALRVLPIFENAYPNDDRPRKAVEAAQAYLNKPTKANRGKMAAAGDAAWAAGAAAWAAEDAAGDAARDTAGAAQRKWQNRHLSNLIRSMQ